MVNKLHYPDLTANYAKELYFGKIVQRDLKKAVKLFASNNNVNLVWAINLYLDALKELHNSASDEKYYELALGTSTNNNPGTIARLARAYRDGCGCEKNIMLAMETYQRAVDLDIGWINEMYDTLIEYDCTQSCSNNIGSIKIFIINKLIDYANEGNPRGMGRLGKAYIEGKIVDYNKSNAIFWMSKALDSKLPWAKKELEKMNTLDE